MATIQIEKKEMVEVEVNYPLFKQHGSAFYKITENETIEVNHVPFYERGFRVGKICYTDLVILNGTDITEQDFNRAFMETLDFLQSKSPLFNQTKAA